MEPMEGDPLLSLGLVDPAGNAVPTSDWAGPDTNHKGDANGVNDRSQTTSQGATSGDTVQSASAGTQQASTGQAQIDWDAPENPYRPDPIAQARTTFQSRAQQLDSERPVAMAILQSQGMQPAQAQAMVDSLHAAALANLRVESDRIAMLPAMKQMSADDIAKQFSTSNVTIDPKELVKEPTLEAMQAKARTIVAERRDRVVTDRSQAGADRVERTGTTATIDYSQLSPHAMISLGLRRGQ